MGNTSCAGNTSYTGFKLFNINIDGKKIKKPIMLSTPFFQFLDHITVETGEEYEQILVNDKIYNKTFDGHKPMGEFFTDDCEIQLFKNFTYGG